MSDALPTEWVVGEDTYAVRTFKAEDGQLTSVNQGGGHWADGVCIATCRRDPEHVAPLPGCRCGVDAWWTVEQLLDQYAEWARYMVAVIRMADECIDGPNGARAGSAQIVAWWCAEDAPADLIVACQNSAPNTRRFYSRDVMTRLYPPPPATERGN
jgi:hypothetical protein